MIRNSTRLVHITAVLTAISALPALAQVRTNPQPSLPPTGLMLGSTIDDRTRGRDRDRNRRDDRRQGNPGWTGGVTFIPGYGYGGCDQPVVIVNNSPCYIPGYYAGLNGYNSYGAYGYNGALSAGFQAGGLSLGYRQNSGYYNQNYSVYPVYPQQPYSPQPREYAAPDPAYQRDIDRSYDARSRSEALEDRRVPSVVPSGSSSEENDYYLHKKPSPAAKNPALAEAIRDIESAFRTGNLASLEKHIDRTGKLVLQVKGTTRQEMLAEDYLAMTRDAVKVMKTARYELTKVDPASNGAIMVTGTHALRTEDGQQKTFTVGFILKPRGDKWLITEVSAEPAK